MRSEIFLLGIIMVIIGPILVALAFSSCLGTILSGNVFGCVSDIAYVIIGGVFFVAGIITSIVGLVVADPAQTTPTTWTAPSFSTPVVGGQVTCKKCGRVYEAGQFFCPSCGQRRS